MSAILEPRGFYWKYEGDKEWIKLPFPVSITVDDEFSGCTINNMGVIFDAIRYISAHMPVKQIIFNGVTTICIFHDGTKVISRPQKGERFDRETGVAMCIAKYIYGSRSKFLRAVESGYEQKRGDE